MSVSLCMVLLLGLGLVSGCGVPSEESESAPVLKVGTEFQSYVGRFEQVSGDYGTSLQVTNLVVEFGPVQNSNERGACEVGGGRPPTITVNREKWDRLTDAEREEFMFHEMGHCVLRRAHRAGLDVGGKPVSIMHPVGMDGQLYRTHEHDYLKELFGRRNEF